MARVQNLGPAAALEASAHCRPLSPAGVAGTVRRSQMTKKRSWRLRRRPGPGAGPWALWHHCIHAQRRGPGTLHLLRGPSHGPPPRRKRMGCWLEGPGPKGVGEPLARIALSVENLSGQRITSKCICECTQASAPTSVHTVTTRAPSLAHSSITCSATTGSRGVGQALGHPRSRHPLPSGVRPSHLGPSQLLSLRHGWRVQPALGLPRVAPRRGPVGSPPAPGGPCATGEAVRPNPWTCPCGRGRVVRPGRGVPSTDASFAPLPLEHPSSWPCICKCTTAVGLGAAGRPRPMDPHLMPGHRRQSPLPALRWKGRRAQGCRDRERLGWGAKNGREPS